MFIIPDCQTRNSLDKKENPLSTGGGCPLTSAVEGREETKPRALEKVKTFFRLDTKNETDKKLTFQEGDNAHKRSTQA
jgi:hypothetical protein